MSEGDITRIPREEWLRAKIKRLEGQLEMALVSRDHWRRQATFGWGVYERKMARGRIAYVAKFWRITREKGHKTRIMHVGTFDTEEAACYATTAAMKAEIKAMDAAAALEPDEPEEEQ